MARPRIGQAPLLPNKELCAHARELLQHLDDDGARFVLWDKESDYQIELNEDVYGLLRNILIDLAQNRAVQIMPLSTEFTTVQAAEFLQVSRPYLIKLIDQGEISCRMVGTHRRIELSDLMNYRQNSMRKSKELSDEMAKEAQELDWGY